jgi:hypothetical protein
MTQTAAGQPGQNDHCQTQKYCAFHVGRFLTCSLLHRADKIRFAGNPPVPSSDIGPIIPRVQKSDKTVAFRKTLTVQPIANLDDSGIEWVNPGEFAGGLIAVGVAS